MSGMKLGDLMLDPRGVVFIPSLRALVCSELKQALASKNSKYVREVGGRVDHAIRWYAPETVIVLGPMEDEAALSAIARRWGAAVRFVFVSAKPAPDARAVAEALKFEVHHELAWDKYRFLEKFDKPPFLDPNEVQTLDFQFLAIAGGGSYFVRIGKVPFDPLGLFSGIKLNVFLKGLGRFKLPALDPGKTLTSVFAADDDPFFDRYDVFAMGHSRILPLGKVTDLRGHVSLDALPIKKRVLRAERPRGAQPQTLPN